MQLDFVFSVSHPEYYESLSRYPTRPDYEDHVRSLIPASWTTGRSGPWLHVNVPDAVIPAQGFKIHVSSIWSCSLGVLSAVVPELVRRRVPFKLTADPGIHRVLNSKGYDRGGAGKFMTIYPESEAAFRELIEVLHQATSGRGFDGPYILSDRRYRDSRILHYRYGGFLAVEELSVDGMKSQFLVAPDGSRHRDVRTPYFELPGWVKDPFPEDEEPASSGLMDGRFVVESVLATSNRGGVYTARDNETGQTVVLKEVRPHVNRMTTDGISLDGLDFLRNEYQVLQLLAPYGFTPRPLALFPAWEHLFLAEERIEAMGLKRFLAQHENLALSFRHKPGMLSGWIPRFCIIARQLLAAVEQCHRLGIVIGDLSINNVMVDAETLHVWLIDLESAVAVDRDPEYARISYFWYTPGFARVERDQMLTPCLEPADDHFALAMILLNLFVGAVQFVGLQRDGTSRLLDRLVEVGVPEGVRVVIESLIRSDVAGAQDALQALAG